MFISYFMRIVNIHVKHDYSSRDLAIKCASGHTQLMNIEKIRRLRGLNQTELAEMANLSQPAISRAEKGADGVTLRQFRAISGALKVPLADLFQEDRSRKENELLDSFRQLGPDRQALWLEMSRTFARSLNVPISENIPTDGQS